MPRPAASESRRRWLKAMGGLALATVGARFVLKDKEAAPSLPALVIPPTMNAHKAMRMTRLHALYDGIYTATGLAAMRARIAADIRGYRGYDMWLDAITDWIHRVAWPQAADLLVDIAEICGTDARRTCASRLAIQPSPLVTGVAHGARIVRLHAAETDGAAITYWAALRSRLGV